MYSGIDHTAIASKDPEGLANWYEQNLEMPIVQRVGSNVFVRAADGTMLELLPAEGDAVETGFRTPGIRHVAIRVDDFEAGVQDLASKQIEIFEFVEVGPIRLAFFLDPEGNILHLIYRG